MKYVIGIDLGTSAVKTILVDTKGKICAVVSKNYPLLHEKTGYSEQNPEEWVQQTASALNELIANANIKSEDIEGISYSGQMHGLVMLDENYNLLRNAILWNDTRTTEQCHHLYKVIGKKRLLKITKNQALEGFTLPKLLWVKEYEPAIFEKTAVFMLPKDYLRFKMTGFIHSEYSDAAGTLLLNISKKKWDSELCQLAGININLCPPLVESSECIGNISESFSQKRG